MRNDKIESASFSELLEAFINGDFEISHQCNNEAEIDTSIRAGNRLWDEMSSLSDIIPLFNSPLESCLSLGAYIVYEEGEKGCELMDLMATLSNSKFTSVRCDVCRSLWVCWHNKYSDALIRFLRDPDSIVRSNAIALMARIPDEDFTSLICMIKSDKLENKELENVVIYFSAFRSGNRSDLQEIVCLSGDEQLANFHRMHS